MSDPLASSNSSGPKKSKTLSDRVKPPEQIGEKLNYKIRSKQDDPLSEKDADVYLALPIFPGERDADLSHVQALSDLSYANQFLWETVIIATAFLRS